MSFKMKGLFVFVGFLGLSGCGTISTGEISERVKQIQEYTKLVCSFVPTVGTVAGILSKGKSDSTVKIAEDICLAVTTAPLADGKDRVPRVQGVKIKGNFVK